MKISSGGESVPVTVAQSRRVYCSVPMADGVRCLLPNVRSSGRNKNCRCSEHLQSQRSHQHTYTHFPSTIAPARKGAAVAQSNPYIQLAEEVPSASLDYHEMFIGVPMMPLVRDDEPATPHEHNWLRKERLEWKQIQRHTPEDHRVVIHFEMQ